MFSGQKGVHALNVFKWKGHSTSSLTTGLLNDGPHEIELSSYHRAPSHCSESPSGLLDGLRNAKCGMDAVESGIRPCDLSKEALHNHPLTPFTISKAIIVGYLGILSVYCIFCFLRFFAQLKETLKIRRFYYNSLGVTDNEIQTMPWSSILEKVVQVQNSQQLCVVKDLSIHDVVTRLMRKENYLIGMLNKGVLAFPMSWWVPGAGTTVNIGSNGVQHRLVLPKTLEWTLNWCILQSMFDRNFRIRRDFVNDPNTLKKRLMIVGFALLLLSPFLVIFMLVYLFLRHAEQFYNHPSTASSRRWSNLSKWMFREFNEVDHLFKHRMNSSIEHASDYLKQFPSPILSIVAKFISFVSGGFAAVLIIIAFLEESLLEGHIFGRNLLWYAAVFGTITAVSRAAVMDELLVFDRQGAMSLVVQHTHFMPKRWRGKENTEAIRLEFETLFQYTGMMLLEEMASIFLTPYLLLFVVPKRVDDILQFVMDFTVDVEGVGHICSFSLFDFRNHGNKKYGSIFNSPRDRRSSQGKMEKSFLSFQIAYPSWEPNADGKQFLASLKIFRDRKLQGHHNNPNFRSLGLADRINNHNNSFLFPRETQIPFGNYNQLESMWLIDCAHNNFPYILDWYYTSQNHDRDDQSNDIENPNNNNNKDLWTPPYPTKINSSRYDNWDDDPFDGNDHLEASTSAPLFQESVLRHHEPNGPGGPGKSHWWARTQLQGPGPQTSFLEPPNFFKGASSRDVYENYSDRSVEEEQEHLDLGKSRGLSRTFYMDELNGGDFDLPFDDIYADDPVNLV
ncbi:autophagy protein atg9 [Castilleja foliolosa]|uniref:Autophagy-related protein 9 n=1 Tax=Castilleja foliolosa TaxID=1961234 RepID=A0ABD3E3U8_9LAMI